MGQEAQKIQRDAAIEDLRLAGAKADLKLKQAAGFESQAADARAREQALKQAGAQGLIGVGTQAMKLAPLYSSNTPQTTTVGDKIVSNKLIADPNSQFFRTSTGEVVDLQKQFEGGLDFQNPTNIFEETLPSVSVLPEIKGF